MNDNVAPAIHINTIVFHVADLEGSETFWVNALGYRRVASGSDWVLISGDGYVSLFFQQKDDAPAGNQGIHMDLKVSDLDTAVRRLAQLGAEVVARHSEHDTTWTTMRDPSGYLFDVELG